MTSDQDLLGWLGDEPPEQRHHDAGLLRETAREFAAGFDALDGLGPAVTIFGSARTPADHPSYQLTRRTAAALGPDQHDRARLPPTDYTFSDHHGVMKSLMALNIKNPEVERLAAEVAELTGESKTEAIRQALLARHRELTVEERLARLQHYLETEVRPRIPPELRDNPVTKAEREEIIGIGPEGY